MNRKTPEDAPVFGNVSDTEMGNLVRGPSDQLHIAEANAALPRWHDAHNALQCRRLANAVSPEETDELSFFEHQGNAVQDMALSVITVNVPDFQHGHPSPR